MNAHNDRTDRHDRHDSPEYRDRPAQASVASAVTPGPWCVMRVDDNGNAFVVRQDLDHAEAAALAAEFESRGHKQAYWIRRQ